MPTAKNFGPTIAERQTASGNLPFGVFVLDRSPQMGNFVSWSGSAVAGEAMPSSLHELSAEDIHGAPMDFSQFKGKTVLIVNVASNCGLAKTNNSQLVDIRERLKDEGFEVIAFPCSQFANQEFSDATKILNVANSYDVQYPVMAKIDVNGPDTARVYLFLKYSTPSFRKKRGVLAPIRWNYGKFLVDPNGHVVEYFGPKTNPLDVEPSIMEVMQGTRHGTAPPPLSASAAVAPPTAAVAPPSAPSAAAAAPEAAPTAEAVAAPPEPEAPKVE